MQQQRQLAEVFRDVFGKLISADFKALGQFDRDLIALIEGEQRRNLEQRISRGMPYHYPLTDLDEVGQMGGDMQDPVMDAVFNLINQQLDIDSVSYTHLPSAKETVWESRPSSPLPGRISMRSRMAAPPTR